MLWRIFRPDPASFLAKRHRLKAKAMLNRLSHLSFRTRSSDRDAETDRLRRSRIVKLMEDVASEILLERRGLKARYDEACVSAGFALDDNSQNETCSRDAMLADLSTTVMACEKRLTILSGHLERLAAARAEIGAIDGETADRSSPKDRVYATGDGRTGAVDASRR